jgi:peptide/nickel transport system permease protein
MIIHITERLRIGITAMLEDRTTAFFFGVLMLILLLGLIGPTIAPHPPDETHYKENGDINALASPSVEHPFGTTWSGYDVLSRLLIGARTTVITGLLGGTIIITIGTTTGVTAGYVGGRVDSILMRITDFFYGVPLLPLAIVLVALLDTGFFTSIFIIGMIIWRASARVLRSQVMQIREYPFIQAAEATGASTPRIMVKHILPNVAPMAVLYFAMGIGYTIIIRAGLAFLGLANPFLPGWGIMIRNAYESGFMAVAWWWSIPPGLLISITVLSTFMFGRGYESIATDQGSNEVDKAFGA